LFDSKVNNFLQNNYYIENKRSQTRTDLQNATVGTSQSGKRYAPWRATRMQAGGQQAGDTDRQ